MPEHGPNGGHGARPGLPQWAFHTLSGCRGCERLLLDLNFLVAPLETMAEIAYWPWLLGSRRADLEALPDGALDAAFVAGAVQGEADAKTARLLRAKARRLVAFGACAAFGGLPGLAQAVPGSAPQTCTLAQVVSVDYVVPGCSPPVSFAWAALQALSPRHAAPARLGYLANTLPVVAAAVVAGQEPPAGTVFAGDRAVCATCSRVKEEKALRHVHRPHLFAPEPARCLLEQGVICTGLVTRGGCGGRCTAVGLPCRGCFGPADAVRDPGAHLVSALASTIASDNPAEIAALVEAIVDPLGTFYRYSLPQAMLQPRASGGGEHGG